MKSREMTVYRARGNGKDLTVPMIMMQGKWLRDMGFAVGDIKRRDYISGGDKRDRPDKCKPAGYYPQNGPDTPCPGICPFHPLFCSRPPLRR